MINLKVSEAYAFDYLAILQIKCEIDPKKTFVILLPVSLA